MQLFANNIETTLVASLSSSATTMYVASSSGMPNPTGDDYFLLTLCKRDSSGVESSIEIVKCTAVVSNSLTIVRAQEDTSGTAYASGDIASLRLTAGSLNDNIMQADGLPLAIGRINNPLLHLPLKNSLGMICGTGTVTFTRTQANPQSVSYIDRYGVVQYVDQNEARFEKEGLLIEGASTNKCLQSEDLSNASWLKSNCSISSNATTAPDGTTTADGVIGNTSDTYHRVYQQISTTATSCSFSFFAKKGNKDWAILVCSLTDSSYNNLQSGTTYINLDSGVVGVNNITNFKLTALADGWYYCSGTLVYNGGSSVAYAKIELWSADANNDANFAGDGSTVNTYLWGAQLEETSFATSYIPTTTAAATRAKDVCYVTIKDNIPSVLSDLSVLFDVEVLGKNSKTNSYFAAVSSGGSYLRAYGWYSYYAVNIGGGGEFIIHNAYSYNKNHRFGAVSRSGNSFLYLNGEQLNGSGLVGTTELDFTEKLYLGSYNRIDVLYGHISNFRIYDVALTEAEMRIA